MNFGSIVFTGTSHLLRKVADLVEDETILVDSVTEISEAKEIIFEGDEALLYNLTFGTDQWIDLGQLQTDLENLGVSTFDDTEVFEIIHALTDSENYIEVIATHSHYDDWEEEDQDRLVDLSKLYHLPFKEAELVEEDEDEDEEDLESNDVYNWED